MLLNFRTFISELQGPTPNRGVTKGAPWLGRSYFPAFPVLMLRSSCRNRDNGVVLLESPLVGGGGMLQIICVLANVLDNSQAGVPKEVYKECLRGSTSGYKLVQGIYLSGQET